LGWTFLPPRWTARVRLSTSCAEKERIVFGQHLGECHSGVWETGPNYGGRERAVVQKIDGDVIARGQAEGMLKLQSTPRDIVDDYTLRSAMQIEDGV
jgi:hypothetical protein